ncbi:hypothetical protein BHECKSOX_1401 [Bathymodiolus heckerae thiotrophic gill symbiont]|uniref:hypothetical protein n=1 Tax=Bathymodiolus heckerae thiotrophic gill symbiont TaxID=1052212 RepID=UPI0010B4D680|nr:hypothetical protein [Bathymodiolus heckerae thiotrophic gill symbiont]CAC9579930.1 hypothetical protein [uncultured Gammaproteobacteria bacterium]SHN91126.1 hypothetical protein BHECKSOX_1401 [Bathymodiolus heckerae thiotrophic gill symbiont]
MKGIRYLFAMSWTIIALGAFAVFGLSDDDKEAKASDAVEKTADECEIPAFAKAIGHEDLWLKHNGCPPREESDKTDKE